jgi:8-oxo-dGTP diphosphatase
MIDLIVRGLAVGNDGKVLSVKHIGKNYWCLPGGKVEDGEELTSAMKREMVEELGVEPEIGRLLHVYQFFMGNTRTQRLEFIFEIKNINDYARTDFTKTSHGLAELEEVAWLDLTETPQPFLPDFIKEYALDPSLQTDYTQMHISRE